MNFTDSYLERLMKQRPVDRRPKGCEPPPEGHPCHGCGNACKPCLLPCYRTLKIPSFLADKAEQIPTIQKW